MKRFFAAFMASFFSAGIFFATGRQHTPYEGSRIYWDVSSQKVIFPSGNYARMTQLADGRLMAVAEAGGGISVCYSTDDGETWSPPELIIRNADRLPYAVPDLIQLTDGTILVGFNPRPSTPYSDERRFGIRAMRSTDNGQSWDGPIFIYDAQASFEDGCWEPSFLELPSGEIHCYFANENNFTHSNEQEISVSRSFDGGVSWSEPTRVCYRTKSRDGMPSAILTPHNEIVVIIEDNGHSGYGGFRATTIRCTLEDNWKSWVNGSSRNRNMIFLNSYDKRFISAAPYLRVLKTGETIASWQGDHGTRAGKGENFFDMFVAVGDDEAKNFKSVSQPFGLDLSQHALWNSVAVGGNGTVYALASIGDAGHGNAINVMQGYAMRGFEANYGTAKIDGLISNENWTKKNALQVFMGEMTRNSATMDFMYDDEKLYFYGHVTDRTIYKDEVDNDGIFLYLDIENCCETSPQRGMFRLFLNVNGEIEFSKGDGGKWSTGEIEPEMEYAVKLSRNYYAVEISVPWKMLGCRQAPTDKLMRCNIEVRDRRNETTTTEVIADTDNRQSWTWPEFRLNINGGAKVEKILPDKTCVPGLLMDRGNLRISSDKDLSKVTVYTVTGAIVTSAVINGKNASVPLQGSGWLSVVELTFSDGSRKHMKYLVQ